MIGGHWKTWANCQMSISNQIQKSPMRMAEHPNIHNKKAEKAKLNVDKFIGRHQFSIVLSLRRNLWFHYVPS